MGAIQNKVAGPVSEELTLVQAAKRGDDSAFEELVRRYDRNVFRIAQHITQNREDAEDVVQEAFLKAYGNLAQFQEQSKFYTWLVRIAVNEALMKLRRRKPERTVSLDEDIKTEDDSLPREIADWSPNPEQQYTQAELREILSKTIQGLPPGFRTVFVLRDVEGLSPLRKAGPGFLPKFNQRTGYGMQFVHLYPRTEHESYKFFGGQRSSILNLLFRVS